MMNRRISSALMLLAALLMLAACAQPAASPAPGSGPGSQPSGSEKKEPVKVGVPIPLTGSFAAFGERIKNGMNLALQEINAKGGVRGGQPLELVFEDNQSKPEVAMAVMESLITKQKVVMVTGEMASSTTFPAAQVAERQGIPFLVSTAAADNITQQGWKNIFRMVQPSSEFSGAAQDFMAEVLKPKTLAIVFENSLFGKTNGEAIRDWAKAKGIAVNFYQSYEAGGLDFKPMLIKLKQSNPEAIFYVSYLNDGILLMRQTQEMDVNAKAIFGAGAGFAFQELIDGVGKGAEYVFTTAQWWQSLPYKGAEEFHKKYTETYKQAIQGVDVQGYAAVYVVADTLNRAKDLSHAGVREALASTDMETVYGPVKFVSYDKFTNQNRLPTVLLQIQKSTFAPVYPDSIKKSPPVLPVPAWKDR